MTSSKEKAKELIKEGCFNSISEGTTYFKDGGYLIKTEGALTLSKIAYAVIRDIKSNTKKHKLNRGGERTKGFIETDPLLNRLNS